MDGVGARFSASRRRVEQDEHHGAAMTLHIVTADERLAAANSKTTVAIFGPPGVGKTSLLGTLLASTTLCVDLEAGMKAVQDWPGDSIPIRSWLDAVDIACLIGGVDPCGRPQRVLLRGPLPACRGHLSGPGPADRVEAHHLRRQHHRADPPVHGLGQDPARGVLREDRQARCPRRLRPARARGDRAAEAHAACAWQDRDLRRRARAHRRRVRVASTGSRRWRAAKPHASCRRSSIRSSP